jgi:DnaJ-class molecular chaperone
MVSEPTLYDILGCPENASQAEIKTAYHRKARELHPDRSGSPDPALFQQLQAAYECLSDAQSRAQYDRTGQAPGQRPEQRSWRQSDGGYGGYADFEHHFHYGPSPFTSTSSYRRSKASSQTIDLPVDLKDFFVGRAFKFDIKKKVRGSFTVIIFPQAETRSYVGTARAAP